MVTKAIVKKVEQINTENGDVFYSYRVQIPIFHGLDNKVVISELPYAYLATLPMMHRTKLAKNTVVYVAIEDYKLETVVILGVVPNIYNTSIQEGKPIFGSAQSLDKADQQIISFGEVDEFVEQAGARTVLSGDNLVIIGSDGTTITWDNIKALANVTKSLNDFMKKVDKMPKIEALSKSEYDRKSKNSSLDYDTAYLVYE